MDGSKVRAPGRSSCAGVHARSRSHVFDPPHIEDVLDRGLPEIWREEDALAATENRRRGAQKAAMKKAAGKAAPQGPGAGKGTRTSLRGWDDFDVDGLLR